MGFLDHRRHQATPQPQTRVSKIPVEKLDAHVFVSARHLERVRVGAFSGTGSVSRGFHRFLFYRQHSEGIR